MYINYVLKKFADRKVKNKGEKNIESLSRDRESGVGTKRKRGRGRRGVCGFGRKREINMKA